MLNLSDGRAGCVMGERRTRQTARDRAGKRHEQPSKSASASTTAPLAAGGPRAGPGCVEAGAERVLRLGDDVRREHRRTLGSGLELEPGPDPVEQAKPAIEHLGDGGVRDRHRKRDQGAGKRHRDPCKRPQRVGFGAREPRYHLAETASPSASATYRRSTTAPRARRTRRRQRATWRRTWGSRRRRRPSSTATRCAGCERRPAPAGSTSESRRARLAQMRARTRGPSYPRATTPIAT